MEEFLMIGVARTLSRVLLGFSIALSSAAQTSTSTSAPATAASEERTFRAFAAIHPIDVHVHVFKTDPAFQKMLEGLNLRLMDILVMDDTESYRKQLQPQVDNALELVRSSRRHIALCTTFDPYKLDSASFDDDAINQINRNFAQGAVAVKIWKNIGMEIKDSSGQYVMADDSRFEPIYKDIASHGKTLMAHQAEPDVAWGPPDPSDPSSSYDRENPQWYVAGRPGFPSKQKILEARDHVLANNPQLRMVGVHLGSMERDLDNIARHFDKYPNFAIDTAENALPDVDASERSARVSHQVSGSCPLRHRSRFPRGRQSRRSGERLAVQLRA
jgi:hypothetical protein